RPQAQVALIEAYCKEQGLWATGTPDPQFTETVELDLSRVVPRLAGPRRPQDRVALSDMKESWRRSLDAFLTDGKAGPAAKASVTQGKETFEMEHGAVVISAITSCT